MGQRIATISLGVGYADALLARASLRLAESVGEWGLNVSFLWFKWLRFVHVAAKCTADCRGEKTLVNAIGNTFYMLPIH